MNNYRPSPEVLTTCGFKRSPAPGEWSYVGRVHMSYVEADHTIQVYNGPPEIPFHLTSQSDEAFQAEVQGLTT